MFLVGDDEGAVDAGPISIPREAARSFNRFQEPLLARGKGVEARADHLARDVNNDLRWRRGRRQDYLKGVRVPAGQRREDKNKGQNNQDITRSGYRQLGSLR